MIQFGFYIPFKNIMNIFWLDLKNTSDIPKLHTFLRLHVSDYKISGTTSAGPVVDQTCILKK